TPLRRAVLRADHGRDAARGQHERHRPTDRVPRGLGRTAGPVQRARRHPPAGGAGMTRGRPAPELVLLGADIGVYAIARAFHEEYGTIATAICRTAAGPIKGSKIIEAIPLGEGAEDGEIIDALLHLAGQRPNARPHLMANADKLIRLIDDHRAELDPHYVIDAPLGEVLDEVSDKAQFARLCDRLDIPTP